METAQGSQILPISKRGRQLQELPSIDQEEFNAPPKKGSNLRPLLRTLQRKALLIIGIAGVVTFAAWYSTKNAKPSYEGGFRLLVEPVTNEARAVDPSTLTRSGGGQVPGQDAFRLDYTTQLEILRSPKIMSDIFEKVHARYPKFSPDELVNGLKVERYQSKDPQATEPTKMLEITFQGKDPSVVQYVLETTANRFLKYSLEERKSRISEGVKFIEDQLPDLQKRVGSLQSQMQRLQQQNRLTDPEAQGQEIFTQVREAASKQSEAESELAEQKRLYLSLQNQLQLTPDEAIASSALSEDPNYRELQTKIQEIDNQLAIESGRFLPDSPTIVSLRDKRQNLLTLQNSETQRILGQSKANTGNNPQVLAYQNSVRLDLIKQMVDAANKIQLLEIQNQSLIQTKNSLEREAQRFPAVARQYNDIKQQLEITKQTLNQLLTQRETLRIEAAQKQVPWELFSKPQITRDENGNPVPAAGNSKKMLMAGGAGGILLGVGVAILLEKSRNIFYNTEEMKEVLELPLLGVIPPYKSAHPLPSSSTLALEDAETSNQDAAQFLKSFDSLYASIRFLFSDRPVRSLAVCSATSGDGKSTVALHLAQTAAAMGQRVLLVDANLRQPQLHTLLNLPNDKGLSDLLTKKLALDDLIPRAKEADNLFVLTAGQPLSNATKLLGSAQMQYLMEEFQAIFDLVIYDTSHLLNRMDANFLAAHTDGVLLVVGVRKTSRSVVKQVLDQLNTFRLPTLGIVANHVNKNSNIPYAAPTNPELKLLGDELQVHPRA